MDNIREKLVELLRVPIHPQIGADPAEVVADYLMDNGVTVQEWIPVSERLPQDEKPVLAYYGFNNNGDYGLAKMFVGTLSYFYFEPHPHWQHQSEGLVVTHWMPLPEVPKGE